MKYVIWRGCERLGLLPPDVQSEWNENNILVQAEIIAYEQVRSYEDAQLLGFK